MASTDRSALSPSPHTCIPSQKTGDRQEQPRYRDFSFVRAAQVQRYPRLVHISIVLCLPPSSLLLHISSIRLLHPFSKILPALGLVRLQATRFVGCVLPNMDQAAGGTEEAVMCRDRRCVEGRTWMSGRGRWMPGVCERRQWRPCCIDVHHTQRPGRENIEKSFDR
jgi:hypothetical protein